MMASVHWQVHLQPTVSQGMLLGLAKAATRHTVGDSYCLAVRLISGSRGPGCAAAAQTSQPKQPRPSPDSSQLSVNTQRQRATLAPSAAAKLKEQGLKVPLPSEQTLYGKPQPQQVAGSPAASWSRLSGKDLSVLRRFVGGLTKDGRKTIAQRIFREALDIIQRRILQGTVGQVKLQ
ncbi:hypothetical protein QJQ45_024353 [Haematococcus lacustris]|nr:hypothetical protein QJQ45_024353 [Haematococcus lacustris]